MITIAEYLFKRIKELGVDDIFGVPGDYNLSFVDLLEQHKDLTWRGNCNELNAAYSADGYARVNGFGAVITTYGVGELSALNGIAGAFSEQVPIIHIAGGPALHKQDKRRKIHHSLGNGNFDSFEKIYKNVCHTTAILNFYNACDEIDRVILDIWKYRYPVYLLLPEDVATYLVPSPKRPLDLALPISNKEQLSTVFKKLTSKLASAKTACVLLGEEINRYQFNSIVGTLLEKTQLPFMPVWGSKGVVDECKKNYGGLYRGAMSHTETREFVESADLVLAFGVSWDEINTAGFTHKISSENLFDFHSCNSIVGDCNYHETSMFDIIRLMLDNHYKYTGEYPTLTKEPLPKTLKGSITQKYLPSVFNSMIDDSSVLLADTGTSLFNSGEITFTGGSKLIIGKVWASIGYATPATLGASIALKNRGRAILISGDGAFQMTAQALSTMLNKNVKPIIFIINNHGYTIERMFHGKNSSYNDIQEWNYTLLPAAFGGETYTEKVYNMEELESAVYNAKKHKDKLCLIEVVMDKYDQPQPLLSFVTALKPEKITS